MARLTHNDLIVLLLAISTMLIMSRMVGELGKRVGLPMVMGELLVGIGLGPTVLGSCFPAASAYLFPFATSAGFSLALDGILSLSVIMLLFVAGLELQLSQIVHHGKVAIYTGFGSMVLPFTSGFAMAYLAPQWFGVQAGGG
ncbi:MAG TPA: cation:proton antiporter, partial [Desulfurivibrionaceae bacterium]|nr:cation:proton antiporter [Desulfurivibrionaceae bacterium]